VFEPPCKPKAGDHWRAAPAYALLASGRFPTNALVLVLPVIGIATLVGGSLFLLGAARHARRPATGEGGLTPVYCEQAGGRFNGMNWSIPFVRIATFEGFVSISCITTPDIILKKGEVTKIERERHLFSVGVRLYHRRTDLPTSIVLWPRDIGRLEAALKASLLS
jgi:hypothetical protein